MEKIEIRKSAVEDSKLILIDVDGNTIWAETDKEAVKEYLINLIDDLCQ